MVYKLYLSSQIYTGIEGQEEPFAGSILVLNGKIRKVMRTARATKEFEDETSVKFERVDFGDKVIMPGLIDTHVHINEPGRTQWEGFATATKAAAAGGFTTIFDMPLNSIPPTTTVDNLKVKAKVAKDKAFVDLGFWGGVVGGVGGNANELKEMIRLGVVGFKCFLCPSGIDEFQQVTEEDVDKALTQLQGTGSLLAFHAEFEAADPGSGDGKDGRSYSTYLESRPENMEIEGVKLVIRQGQKHSDVRVHIVHLATADAIPLIQEARNTGGINLSVETCHHYLGLNSTMIPDGHTEYKCAPPIRDAENQEGLWKGIINGDIDQVVSDHSPSTPDVKLLLDTSVDKGNFLKAWGGIASNQLGLSLMWTNGQTHGITIPKMIKLMATKPAQLMGYEKQKGLIRDNYDADFVVWSPEEYFKVSDYEIKFKNKANPYEGRYLQGVVHNTILRGEIIYDRMDATVGTQATGELLLKTLF